MIKTNKGLTIGLMTLLFLTVPVSGILAKDTFTDAGFIRAKKPVAAPNFTLSDINGKQVQLSDFKGKTVLVYFWATW